MIKKSYKQILLKIIIAVLNYITSKNKKQENKNIASSRIFKTKSV